MRNVSPIDGFTLSHIATGYLAARVGMPLSWYVGLSVAYEILEHRMEFPRGSKFFGTKQPESKINAITDVGAGVLGYKLGERR